MKNYRHGDMALIGIKELPKNLTASKSKVLMVGSHGNNHAFQGEGTFYPHEKRSGNVFIVGYLVAKDVELTHLDHGDTVLNNPLKVAIIDSGIYEVRKQVEDTNEGMKPVED